MQDITVLELKARLDQGETPMIIDVREPWEFEEFNIQGKLIPLSELPGQLDSLTEYRDSEIIVHCRSGARSATAKAFLAQQGFANVRNLLGGMMDWQANFGG
ncbi:MAG: rhodanese-like domain-containing protein [Bacteroidota bacterium]|jgi:rhodanese-related sulfurtransferase